MITDIKVVSDLGEESIKSEMDLVAPTLQAELKVNPSNLSTVVENENELVKNKSLGCYNLTQSNLC
mgnify:CR=1 FL=1